MAKFQRHNPENKNEGSHKKTSLSNNDVQIKEVQHKPRNKQVLREITNDPSIVEDDGPQLLI